MIGLIINLFVYLYRKYLIFQWLLNIFIQSTKLFLIRLLVSKLDGSVISESNIQQIPPLCVNRRPLERPVDFSKSNINQRLRNIEHQNNRSVPLPTINNGPVIHNKSNITNGHVQIARNERVYPIMEDVPGFKTSSESINEKVSSTFIFKYNIFN